jgi:hypothetical protein
MLMIALGLFAIGALFGATMAVMHFRGVSPPRVWLAAVHSVFVAAGLIVLFVAVWPGFSGRAAWALGIFLLAALGGFTMALGFHMRGKRLPSALVLGHGALAVIAFLILLFAAFAVS